MKRAIVLMLAVIFFLGAFLWFPRASFAHTGHCYGDWEYCRSRAFASDEGIIRTTILLTVCDIAFGRCLLLD